MNRNRRTLLGATGALVFSLMGSGCTSMLLSDHKYEEVVSAVLISEDSSKLVVLGKDFHYIFDAPPRLVSLLNSPLRDYTQASFSEFKVDQANQISGRLALRTRPSVDPQVRQQLVKAGFIGRHDYAHLPLFLKGDRYSAQNFPADVAVTHKLSQTYRVPVSAELTLNEKRLRFPLTPITVAVDGTLILTAVTAVVVLSPIWIPWAMTQPCRICGR